jgi:hypothetical protein
MEMADDEAFVNKIRPQLQRIRHALGDVQEGVKRKKRVEGPAGAQ